MWFCFIYFTRHVCEPFPYGNLSHSAQEIFLKSFLTIFSFVFFILFFLVSYYMDVGSIGPSSSFSFPFAPSLHIFFIYFVGYYFIFQNSLLFFVSASTYLIPMSSSSFWLLFVYATFILVHGYIIFLFVCFFTFFQHLKKFF